MSLYVVLHLYKTAGQTLLHNFRENYKRRHWLPMYVGPIGLDIDKGTGSSANPGWIGERVNDYVRQKATAETRCLFGHMAYVGVHELVPDPADARYIVFLRDPIERVVSLYSYLKYKSSNYWHREIVENNWTLEEWLDQSRGLWLHNGQLRQLLIGTYPEVETERELTAAHLAEGRRRLQQQFWFIGLTETFKDDARYLYGRLNFTRFHPEARVNANPQKDAISPAVRQQIIACNQLDMELYAFGRTLRSEMVRRNRPAYHYHQLRAAARRFIFERNAARQTSPSPARQGKVNSEQ